MAEQVADYGYGTIAAIDTVEQLIVHPEHRIDTVLINLMTLIRNRCNRNDVPSLTVLNEVREDMVTISKRLDEVFPKSTQVRPVVVFYMIDYRRVVVDNLRRPVPKSKAVYDTAWANAYTRLRTAAQELRNCTIHQVKVTTDKKPWVPLYSSIKRLQTALRIAMISHMPCDYHLMIYCPTMILVDSYTGNIHTPDGFGLKVFGDSAIPFCPITHALLGDKELIKPTIVRNEKKRLLAMAETDHWKFKPAPVIKQRMMHAGFIPQGVRYPFV